MLSTACITPTLIAYYPDSEQIVAPNRKAATDTIKSMVKSGLKHEIANFDGIR